MNRFCPHLVGVLILLLLSGCDLLFEQPFIPRLIGATVHLAGVDSGQAEVNADGFWEVTSGSSWLIIDPTSGIGPTTVALTVATENLMPGSYSGGFTTYDSATGQETFIPVVFSFPQLRGDVVEAGTTSVLYSLQSSGDVPSGPGRLLVGLRDPHSEFSVLSAERFQSLALRLASSVPPAELKQTLVRSRVAVFETSDRKATARQLLTLPEVTYVEPDRKLELLAVDDTYRSQQWALDIIGADSAWNVSTGERSRIAIIDSGFNPAHEDLRNKVAYTYDFGDNSSSIVPTNGSCGAHGDHVAGIAAAETDNFQGVAGVGFDADLLLLDVNTAFDSCSMYTSSIIGALDWLAGDGSGPRADVVNISIGVDVYQDALHDAVKAAYNAGVTIVAAAGNDGAGTILYPAKHPEVIAVSATDRTDEVTNYSATGPEIWISAPGGEGPFSTDKILSTITDSLGSAYGYMEGTSMASPAVAGVAALVLSVNSSLLPADVADVLAESSLDLGTSGRDESYGHGRLDAAAAASLAQTYIPDSMTYLVRSSDGRVLTVPADGQFDFGYTAPGILQLEAMTDDDRDGVPGETGEYYGKLEHTLEFDGPFDDVVITVDLR